MHRGQLMIAGLLVSGLTPLLHGAQITITGTGSFGSTPLSASATFSTVTYNGKQYLQVNLSNSSGATNDPQTVLTGIFFDYNHGGTAGLLSVTGGLDTFASYKNDPTGVDSAISNTVWVSNSSNKWQSFPGASFYGGSYHDSTTTFKYSSGNVGGEWDFAGGSSALPGVSEHFGIGASGFNDFGPSTRFDTTEMLSPPPSGSPGGVNWGLISQTPVAGATVPSNLTGTQQTPLIAVGAEFRLLITMPAGQTFDVTKIDDARFQYGTSTSEASFFGTPTPPSSVPLPSVASSGAVVFALAALAHLCTARLRRPTRAA